MLFFLADCRICCRYGHNDRDCKERKCFRCNRKGHFERECTNTANLPNYRNKESFANFLIFVVLLLSGTWYMRFRSWKQCNYHMHTQIPCPGHTRSGCLLEKIHNEAIRAYLAEETEPTQGNVHNGNS